MKTLLLLSTLVFLVVSCQTTTEKTANSLSDKTEFNPTAHHIAQIKEVFDAHGGYETWSQLRSLSYEMNGSSTLTDLQNRYTRIESEEQTIGFDGKDVWVFPATEDADRYRMQYNLMFYFFAFPFVVGDPGINYEVLPPIDLDGKKYHQTKITYNSGVGDAPNDSYIICSDPKTNRMEWLLYTATFGGEPSSKYSLIKYEGWQKFGNILLPTSLQWYHFQNGVVGEPRGGRTFENVEVSKVPPSFENFKMPDSASVAN